ncbi:hypothetical protein CRUP_000159 [Coryphaenoides rupestris]|nr:hypothetical protein CRUP_000159 [Coryphaenoides rupestris]
MFLVLL